MKRSAVMGVLESLRAFKKCPIGSGLVQFDGN